MSGELPTTLAPQIGLDLFRAEFDGAADTLLYAITPQVETTDLRPYRREFMLSKAELLAIIPDGKLLPSGTPPSRLATVTAAKLNIRTGPGTETSAVAQLANGTQVQVTDAITGWLRIVKGEYTGRYISSAYVSFL